MPSVYPTCLAGILEVSAEGLLSSVAKPRSPLKGRGHMNGAKEPSSSSTSRELYRRASAVLL